MNFYKDGILVGASGLDWTISKYKAEARRLAGHLGEMYAVIALEKNGTNPEVQTFETGERAGEIYDVVTNRPNKFVYVALINKDISAEIPDFVRDEAFFVANATHHTHTKKVNTTQSVAGWVFGGIATLFGLMLAGKRKK